MLELQKSLNCVLMIPLNENKIKQENIPVGCVLLACKPYVLQWPQPDVVGTGLGAGSDASRGRGQDGSLYSEVQGITGNNQMGTLLCTDRRL